ncbi:MAG: FAD-dependent oxidoreductase [Spirochaetales bacterium]
MSLRDIVQPFTVWKRALDKPYTSLKPLEERPGAPRYRGFHINNTAKCIGCGTCETICQNEAIDLVAVLGQKTKHGDSGLRPQIDYGRCCWCALCVDMCPTSSLGMSNEYVWIETDPEKYRFVPGVDDKSWNDCELGYRRSEGYDLLTAKRVEMPMLPFAESQKSFVEMVQGYSKEQAMKEADRCIECGLCIATCPAHMNVPAYIAAIRKDEVEEGLRIVYEANPLPASCGRICSHACEYVCAMKHRGEALSIRWLKRYIVDQIYAMDYKKVLKTAEPDNGKTIAIIGSGPGGLAAAYYLRMLGYGVTIYDSKDKAGGMLRYGIPEYRLPYDQIDKDINWLKELGVSINQSVRIGRDISFEQLHRDNDALFFSTGLGKPFGLEIPGDDLPGVKDGLKVLEDVTNGVDADLGDSVVVVGGGNVAMDAARTSRRFNAAVTILYRRRIEDMPADVEEVHESQGEGCVIRAQAIPLRVEKGTTKRLRLVWGKADMVTDGKGGRPVPVLIPGSEEVIECDTVVAAIGQGAEYEFIPQDIAAKLQFNKGNVVVNEFKQTGDPKVFAGGDIVNPKKDAISGIANGHSAAKGIDIWLTNFKDKA